MLFGELLGGRVLGETETAAVAVAVHTFSLSVARARISQKTFSTIDIRQCFFFVARLSPAVAFHRCDKKNTHNDWGKKRFTCAVILFFCCKVGSAVAVYRCDKKTHNDRGKKRFTCPDIKDSYFVDKSLQASLCKHAKEHKIHFCSFWLCRSISLHWLILYFLMILII